MKGDFTRLTFNPKKHFSSVRMQQGRVQLDADWNEQIDIGLYRERMATRDIIGTCGAPINNPGFVLTFKADEFINEELSEEERALITEILKDQRNFIIGKGCYYVNGILCENEGFTSYSEQPDEHSSLENIKEGFYLAYLKVWERHITQVEDNDIQEIALNGADTTTRTKTIWQVKLRGPFGPSENWDKIWRSALPKRKASIAVRIKKSTAQGDPCVISSDISYGRLGNHLYRIEIHNEGKIGKATFKWSRDNGSITWAIKRIDISRTDNAIDRIIIAIESRGVNLSTIFKPGQWIELTNDIWELGEKPGIFSQVISADHFHLILAPKDPKDIEYISQDIFSSKWRPKVRCWDSLFKDTWTHEQGINIEKIEKNRIIIKNPGEEFLRSIAVGSYLELTDNIRELRGEIRILAKVESQRISETIIELELEPEKLDNVKDHVLEDDLPLDRTPRIIPYDPEKEWIELEEGIEVHFERGNNHYRTGDYWLIPARSSNQSIEWPTDEKGRPEYQQNFGKRQYCRLAVLRYSDLGWKKIEDYHRLFTPLTEQGPKKEPHQTVDKNERLKEAINAMLRGNMPSDQEFELLADKSYLGAFEDSLGNIWLFGRNDNEIWSSKYIEGSWEEKCLVSKANRRCTPFVLEDDKSNLWIFWCQNENIWYKKYSLGDWSNEAQITEGKTQKSNLNALEGSQGDIWLFWQQDKNVWCMRRNNSGNWERGDKPLIEGPVDGDPDIFEDNLKNLWILWRQGNNIWSKRYSEGKWQDKKLLSKDDTKKEHLNNIEGSQGDMWVFWLQENNIWKTRYTSGNWEESIQLTSGIKDKQLQEILKDSKGDIWVFWKQDNDIFCRNYSYSSNRWTEKNLTEDTSIKHFKAAIEDSMKNILLFWWQDGSIFYRKFNSNNCDEKIRLTGAPENTSFYAINRKNGDLWILAEKSNSANMWCRRYADGDWLDEVRMTHEPAKKEIIHTFEDRNNDQWLFWKVEGLNHLKCKKYFDKT